jgi:tRNA (adenine22-N1)-methyltransferase
MPKKHSRRLEALLKLVPIRGGVVDVGTDHGYVPISLVNAGFNGYLVATDVARAPLERARAAARREGVSDKIDFILCDGLTEVPQEKVDIIVIAGMGGETISSILSAAPWVRERAARGAFGDGEEGTEERGRLLILQPMSKQDSLREWLFENGYRVLSESLVEERGVIYEILTATGGQDRPYAAGESLTGHFELICRDPLFPKQLERKIATLERVVAGLERSREFGSEGSSESSGEALKKGAIAAARERLEGLLEIRDRLT